MLKDRIDALIEGAMKEKDGQTLAVLRMIKSNMLVLEKSGAEYTEDAELKMLTKMKSSIEDSIAQFVAGGRSDLADNERFGLEVVKGFLPKEASEDEIRDCVESAIGKLNHTPSMKDMKFIMDEVHKQYPTVNGKVVSQILKEKTA